VFVILIDIDRFRIVLFVFRRRSCAGLTLGVPLGNVLIRYGVGYDGAVLRARPAKCSFPGTNYTSGIELRGRSR